MDTAKKFFQSGFAVPWAAHVFLTGVLPGIMIVPFIISQYYGGSDTTGLGILTAIFTGVFTIPFTLGVNGMELMVANKVGWAGAMFVFNMFSNFVGEMLLFMDGGKWSPVLKAYGAIFKFANPLFIFNLIQVWNPNFINEGYRFPFLNTSLTGTLASKTLPTKNDIGYIPLDTAGRPIKVDPAGNEIPYTNTEAYEKGKWKRQYGQLGGVTIGAMLLLMFPAFTTMMQDLPAPWQATINNTMGSAISYISIIAGVLGGGGGIFALTKLPSLLSSAPAIGGSTSAAAKKAPTNKKPPVVPPVVPPPRPQAGGGESLPSLLEAANELLEGGEEAQEVNTNIQEGGATMTDSESVLFVGIIGAVAAMGATLAAFRKKQNSLPTI